MTGGRGSAALLALLPVLWVGGCSAPVTPGDAATTSSAAQDQVIVSGNAPQQQVEDYRVMAEIALGRVEDLWGQDAVRRPARVVLPATAAEFAELTGGAVAGEEVPAVTVGTLAEAHVVVHPDSWDRLTPEGRQAVLTHEVTHLAQQGHGPVPSWLGEGMAEFTAHRHSQLTPTVIAGSALDGVRAGELPATWPDPRGADTAWGGYALSWLACLFIAETWSEEGLLEFYRAVADGTPVAEAFPAVLDVTEDEALVGWGDWLRELVD